MQVRRLIYMATAYVAVAAVGLLSTPNAYAEEDCTPEQCGNQPLYDEQSQKIFQAGCEAQKCTGWYPACDNSTNCTWQVRCGGCAE